MKKFFKNRDYFNIFDLHVINLNYFILLRIILRKIKNRTKFFLVSLNTDILRQAVENEEYFTIINSSDLIFADGMPLIWMSKLSDNPLNKRITGRSLVYDLCRLSAKKGYSLFFLGPSVDSLNKAIQKLKKDLPGINICGYYSPEPVELVQEEYSERIVSIINNAAPDVLFVSLGAPKQETWIAQNYDKLNVSVMLPCGASIDYISGCQRKCPEFIGNIGLEWFYRLIFNPKKLFGRYILLDFPFLWRIWARQIFDYLTQTGTENAK